jgi:uncharacterized membrane protein YfcA
MSDIGTTITLFAIAGILICGGVVKGTLGVGLPLVALPLLALVVPARLAIGLLVVPVLLSNLMQAVEGGRFTYALRRFASLLLAQLTATLVANHWASHLSPRAINAVIAISVISAVLIMLLQPRREVTPRVELWASPTVGAIAGAMGGASSLTGPILITYLIALRMPREEFIGSISVIYLLGAIPMYGAMIGWGRIDWYAVTWSAVAVGPMYLGLRMGAMLRTRISEVVFRYAILAFLALLSVVLLFK